MRPLARATEGSEGHLSRPLKRALLLRTLYGTAEAAAPLFVHRRLKAYFCSVCGAVLPEYLATVFTKRCASGGTVTPPVSDVRKRTMRP